MPYSTLPTVNPGDVISSSSWGNQIKTNEDYLFNGRPGQVIKRDNNADYTTTSTSFVDIDGTNLMITATINSGKALVIFTGHFSITGSIQVDILVDGTRYLSAGADGFGNAAAGNNAFVALVTGLSVGSHTFKPQWKTGSGATERLRAGNGT